MTTEILNSLTTTSNGHKFTLNGHVSQFKDCVIEKHPSMKSMRKFRQFDCRDGSISISGFQSAGSLSIYGIVNGQVCQILPYGRDVTEALEAFGRDSIKEYLAKSDGETLLGSLMQYGYSKEEIDEAERKGEIEILEEGVVFSI